jgi:hypothetical protein
MEFSRGGFSENERLPERAKVNSASVNKAMLALC